MSNIMIVEDEALIALSLQNKLKNFGYDVPVIVHTGEKAVEEADKWKPDLILMDINLGGEMTGTMAATRIRTRQRVPVIFLTSYSDEKTLQQAKESNPFGYILKPFKDRELRSAIEVALHKHKVEQEELKTIVEESDKLTQLNQSLHDRNINKDKLFSIISHDLRGNAWRTDSMLDILITNPEYEELPFWLKDIVAMLKDNSKKNKSLVENLLLWATHQLQRIEFNPSQVYIHEVVEEVENQVHSQLLAKRISFHPKVSKDVVLQADKNMLTIILRNLVSNAIKFSNEESKINLVVSTQSNNVIIEVKDYGIGISPENLNKLMNINIRFSTYGTKGEHGTGFGLELCNDFVKRHNGKIEVESELGKGTTFKVVLPKDGLNNENKI